MPDQCDMNANDHPHHHHHQQQHRPCDFFLLVFYSCHEDVFVKDKISPFLR